MLFTLQEETYCLARRSDSSQRGANEYWLISHHKSGVDSPAEAPEPLAKQSVKPCYSTASLECLYMVEDEQCLPLIIAHLAVGATASEIHGVHLSMHSCWNGQRANLREIIKTNLALIRRRICDRE
jgi:hypothetical protein